MRPDDRSGRWQPIDGPGDGFDGFDSYGPLDADLETLDRELAEAGAGARRALHGQTQPTRFFANRLRERLLAAHPAAAAAPAPRAAARAAAGGAVAAGAIASGHARRHGARADLMTPGEAWAPVALEPRMSRRTPTMLPGRFRWAVLVAASLTGVIAAGALGAKLDWLLPPPSALPSPLTAVDATPRPSTGPSDPTDPPLITVPTVPPTAGPDATPASPKPTATPKPTPRPTPKPTPKPEPTKPPILAMDFMAKACPGGVLLDWTKPSAGTNHYHVLRKLGGDVPATYPAAGTTEVETATSFSATTTDGFDETITGGEGATYRAFAFDGADKVIAHSASRTVTTLGRIPLGALTTEATSPGSITFGWAAADVNAACFTYGKLVASQEDPDPSYLKGTPYLAVIESPTSTGVHLDGLPSGKTFWVRYEIIRATSLGKFVVARTDVVQVTIP